MQHVGQKALRLDRGDRFFARIVARMSHQMNEQSVHLARSLTGSLALYSSFVSSVLKKLLTDGCPARSTCKRIPSLPRTLQRPQIRISGLAPSSLVGNSRTIEKMLACVFESTPLHGDLTPL